MALPPPQQGSLPAGWLAFAGRELNPLDRDERFQITCSSPFPGLTLTLHPALPAARAAQGLPPHPPLRALCQRQPRREYRDGPRTARCHPACRRPAKAARCRAGCATCTALPMPALWRSHDCDRGVRVRLRAEVAADAEQDRHVMSQTFLRALRLSRSDALAPRRRRSRSTQSRRSMRRAAVDALRAPAEVPIACSRPRLRADMQLASYQGRVHHRGRRRHQSP